MKQFSVRFEGKFACRKSASFECFLQKCREKFWNPEERRDHCINVHQFPEDFKFGDVSTVKARNSKPNSKKTSDTKNNNVGTPRPTGKSEMDQTGRSCYIWRQK